MATADGKSKTGVKRTSAAAPAPEVVPATEVDVIDALAAEASGEKIILTVRDQEFTLAEQVPAIIMLRLSAAGDPKTPPPKQMAAIAAFLEHVIVPEDRERFNALLEDAEPIIDFEELNGILEDATEVLAARPT